MNDLYETCRDANRFLAAVAFLWLVLRTVRAWPAEWAKPDHVGHYRTLLIAGSGFMLVVTFGSFLHARIESTATAVDLASSLACLFVLAICARWPKPRAMRKDHP